MDLGPVLLRERHIGEDVLLGLVQERRELRQLGPDLVGDLAPLGLAAPASSRAKAVAMKAETSRRPLLPAWASALRMKCTRQRCQVARNTRATAALMPSCASEITSLTPARLGASACAEVDPERLGLRGADGHAQDLTPAIGVDRDGEGRGTYMRPASRTFT